MNDFYDDHIELDYNIERKDTNPLLVQILHSELDASKQPDNYF